MATNNDAPAAMAGGTNGKPRLLIPVAVRRNPEWNARVLRWAAA